MKFFLLYFLLILTSVSSFAGIDCQRECLNPASPESKCQEYGVPLRYSIKTLIDLFNHFNNPPIQHVQFSPCRRKNSFTENAFVSLGKNCAEWSVHGLDNPETPNDHLNGSYSSVSLPKSFSGSYRRESKRLIFSQENPLPFFSFQFNGKVLTSGYVTSIFEVFNADQERNLVLETDQFCYSIAVE